MAVYSIVSEPSQLLDESDREWFLLEPCAVLEEYCVDLVLGLDPHSHRGCSVPDQFSEVHDVSGWNVGFWDVAGPEKVRQCESVYFVGLHLGRCYCFCLDRVGQNNVTVLDFREQLVDVVPVG